MDELAEMKRESYHWMRKGQRYVLRRRSHDQERIGKVKLKTLGIKVENAKMSLEGMTRQ
jgi:hypothetical protein